MTDHENKKSSEQQVIMVTFQLGSQIYALPISAVRQIIEMIAITPLPQVSETIVGVINFHGTMVPVISMRRLLGLDEIPRKLHTPIILMNMSERLVGLIVDQVQDVFGRPADQVIDPVKVLPKEMGETPLLQGLIHAEGGSILLLNPEHLLKSYQTRALTEAIQAQVESLKASAVEKEDPATVGELVVKKNNKKNGKTSRNRRQKEVAPTAANKNEVLHEPG